MPETKYLVPAEGRTVPLPDGRPWPADGASVTVDRHVRRRLADGDLIEAKPPADRSAEAGTAGDDVKGDEPKDAAVSDGEAESNAEPKVEPTTDAAKTADATKTRRSARS